MKNSVRTLKNQQGFSLIELMIVVAIIGILATIAVPNFNKMQAKAKQSEAKGMLSGLYTAEKSFYGEWSVYYGSFADLGFSPEGKANYHVGFGGTGAPPAAPFVAAPGTAPGFGCANTNGCGTLPNLQPTAAAQPTIGTTDPAGSADWVAAAASQLVTGSPVDRWTINQAKTLTNTINGI